MQKQEKLKNRKPILQTKMQKTAKLTNRKENHGLRNNTEGTVLGRKKSQHTADFEKGTRNSPQNPSRLLKTLLLYHSGVKKATDCIYHAHQSITL